MLLFIFCTLFAAESHAISQEKVQKIEDAVPAKATAVPKQPRKLLVFYLCRGYEHESIPYWNKALEIMGEKTAAFQGVFSDDMSIFEQEQLNQFDAVCFNNSTELEFTPAQRKSLMNFINSGKGIVGIHAATDNFYDWPEAAYMFGGQFCGHPWTADGTWAVKIDEPDHPLMAAFEGENFKINDEIYRTIPPYYSRTTQRILMSLDMSDEDNANAEEIEQSDKDIAISWVKSVGKGSFFYCSLGHNNHITWNPKVLQHYLDGIQFALGDIDVDTTTSLDVLLKDISEYEYDVSQAPLHEIDEYLRNIVYFQEELKQYEEHFISFLQSDATPVGKFHICRKLAQIGTAQSVPVLARMLTNEETSYMARYALESIPVAAADQALRQALKTTTGKIKIGIINSLGRRRDENAVEDLKDLIKDSDTTTAVAAVAALGQIATPLAAQVLEQELDTTNTDLKPRVLDAYLKCADRLADQGRKKQSFKMYKQLSAEDAPTPIRIAALRGIIAAEPDELHEVIDGTLTVGDIQMLTAAIALVGEIPEIPNLKNIAAELPNLPTAQQVQLLSALTRRGNIAALPDVINATRSTQESVRIAALKAIGKLGDASNVKTLAQIAATTTGAERDAARQSLYSLRGVPLKVAIQVRGQTVNNTILNSIPKAESNVKVELIRSVGQRNITEGVETLLETAKDPDRNVRTESLKVLRDIAGPKNVPALVELLVTAESETEIRETERALASASRKAANESTDVVLAKLASVEDVKIRCSLLRILGKIGASKALSVLRDALDDNNEEVQAAAIRGLAEWPTTEPIADLLKVVRSTDNKIHRTLAFRGYVRLIGLDSDRPAKESIEMCKQAMALAENVSEKKMVLSGLANVRTLEAMQMAADYLDDNALQQEAAAAIVRIASETFQRHPEQTKSTPRVGGGDARRD
jgi:type 1 glutamine amidotransferase/HEAT repeat protein